MKEHNPHFPEIPNPPYKILIVACCVSEKTNSSVNLINQLPDIDKTYLYATDPYETKHQFLIYKIESTNLKYINDSKFFIEYLNDMNDFYKSIVKYNTSKLNY